MKTTLIKMALAGLLVAGCYTTRITSGAPPQTVAPLAQDRWHHAAVGGIAEISPPVDLDEMCADRGWSEIREQQTFLNGLVAGVTSSIYTPRTYSLSCGPAAPPDTALR